MPLSLPAYLSTLSQTQPLFLSLPLLSLLAFFWRRHLVSRRRRQHKIPPGEERVLILGASSGVGKELALQYARRGAWVCLVARNAEVENVRKKCIEVPGLGLAGKDGKGKREGDKKTIAVVADFSSAEDMVKVRESIQSQWGRLDTLAVIAGVSSLKPLLATAGIEQEGANGLPDADLEDVQTGIRVANAAITGNFIGPLTAALTFIPFMTRSSPSPSVLLLSSLAAVTPAPTRTLYAASKSASLLLYQSLAIEHSSIHFTFIIPSTIEGNFRASAVDAGTVREADPNKKGLKRVNVAKRCILAVDREERDVFMQGFYRVVPMLYYTVCPGIIEWVAKKKYHYP